MIALNLHQRDLFVAQVNGQLYCGDNRCPHEDIALTLGCLKQNRVHCSLHGFSFDLDTGKSSEACVDSLRTYPIKLENNIVYINM